MFRIVRKGTEGFSKEEGKENRKAEEEECKDF
jgi:hypothetical protein